MFDNKLKIFSSSLCILIQYCLIQKVMLYDGSDCTSSERCTRVRNCPPALESIKYTQSSGLTRCGFVGHDELVCCPSVTVRDTLGEHTNAEQENRFPKRKCEQACEEISNEVKSRVDFHIIGGVDAEIGEFPHMAALGYETDDEEINWNCGASIISNRFLITAAHCIAKLDRVLPKVVRLGVTKLNGNNPQDYPIKNVTVNHKYNSISKHNDIALIEVSRKIKFSEKVLPACLYSEPDDPLGLIVTGWGKTSIESEDDRSNILQKATLIPVSIDKCNSSYVNKSKTIVQTQICAGSNKSDSCWGDSGGPLQIQNKEGTYSVVGIVSYGAGCGGNLPGVYTRVSKYLRWIEDIVWP